MKRINFLFLCIFLMFLTYSCLEPETTEKIEIINQTGEDVIIYYYTFYNTESTLAIISPYDEFTKRFILVAPGTKYYAKGKRTDKDYGERTFVAVPSNVYDQQTWVIIK